MIDTAELHRRIAECADEFVAELFGERVRPAGAGQWWVGARGSRAISVRDGKLVFFDHEAGTGGDAIELWQRERDCDNGEALRASAAWAGLSTDAPAPRLAPPRPRLARPPAPIPDMPRDAADAWTEGREYLSGNAAARREIAEWRGWPVEYVATLAGAGVIAAPKYFHERTRVAFPTCEPVTFPTGEGESPENAHCDRARFVGWHARLKDSNGEKRGWRFVPREDGNRAHPGVRPTPLVLARAGVFGQLWDKKLIVICEGEFDAATLPLALGWFDPTLRLLRIPPGVGIVGIVGAGGGQRVFLDAYRPFWPRNVAAIVLRDADKAGDRWKEPGGFLDVLRERCSRVVSAHFGTGSDGKRRDVNDAWRDGTLTRGVFDALLLAKMNRTLRDAEIAISLRDTPPPSE